MSLLDEAASNLSPYKLMMSEKAGKEVERKFIIQPQRLMAPMWTASSGLRCSRRQRTSALFNAVLLRFTWRWLRPVNWTL